MQVVLGRLHPQFEVGQSAQSVNECGQVRVEDERVAIEHRVAAQKLFVLLQRLGQVGRPDLFLALEEHLHAHRQRIGGENGFERGQVRHQRALHIRSAAGVEVFPAHSRGKRRRDPFLERLGRLDVVMPVQQKDRGLRVGVHPFRIHDLRSVHRQEARLKTEFQQPVHQPFRRPLGFRVVFGKGRYARDLQIVPAGRAENGPGWSSQMRSLYPSTRLPTSGRPWPIELFRMFRW